MALSLRRCLARLGLLVEYRSERADNQPAAPRALSLGKT